MKIFWFLSSAMMLFGAVGIVNSIFDDLTARLIVGGIIGAGIGVVSKFLWEKVVMRKKIPFRHSCIAPLWAAEGEARRIDERLSARDFDPADFVYLITDEKFMALVPSAFVLEWQGWYLVFSEHREPLVFHRDDMESICQLRLVRGSDSFPKAAEFVAEGDK